MKNFNKIIFQLIILGGIAFVFHLLDIRVCPFFYFFHIPCPGCGLTRSVLCLFKLDIIGSIKYNILGLPLIFCCFNFFIFCLFKKEKTIYFIIERFKLAFISLSIILVVILEIININNPLLY